MSNKIITADVLNTYGAEIKAYTDTKTRTYELYNTNVLTAVPTATESYYDGRCAVVKVGDKSPYTYDVYQAKKGSDNKCTWSKIFTLPNEKTYKYNFYYGYSYSSTSGSTYWNGSGFSAYYAGQAYYANNANNANRAQTTEDIKFYIVDDEFETATGDSDIWVTIPNSLWSIYKLDILNWKVVAIRRYDSTEFSPFTIYKATNDYSSVAGGVSVRFYYAGEICSEFITKSISSKKTYKHTTIEDEYMRYSMEDMNPAGDIEISRISGTTAKSYAEGDTDLPESFTITLLDSDGGDIYVKTADKSVCNYWIGFKGDGNFVQMTDENTGNQTIIAATAYKNESYEITIPGVPAGETLEIVSLKYIDITTKVPATTTMNGQEAYDLHHKDNDWIEVDSSTLPAGITSVKYRIQDITYTTAILTLVIDTGTIGTTIAAKTNLGWLPAYGVSGNPDRDYRGYQGFNFILDETDGSARQIVVSKTIGICSITSFSTAVSDHHLIGSIIITEE